VVHVLEKPPREWQGETGFITTELLQRHLDQSLRALEPQFFICGPKPMMDAVERQLAEIGYRFPQVHSERFAL
jgi:ferredoxin-NADP reductase